MHTILQDGRTALYQASIWGHHKVVDLLTNAGAAVDVQAEVCVHMIVDLLIIDKDTFLLLDYLVMVIKQFH